MHSTQQRAWLALHRTPSLTARALCRLISAAKEPEAILQLSSAELNALEISPDTRRALHQGCEPTLLDSDLDKLEQLDIQLIPLSSDNYPELLKQINDPPPILYVRGNVSLLNQPQLGMVGSRNASRQGLENAFHFSHNFAKAGFTIGSGLALGVDAQCHRGALAANGSTVAVLGTGVDRVYPVGNHSLFCEMLSSGRGLLISELPLGTSPRPQHFPKRNRIISGMALGVLVVEAALKSGSLITARCALEQNREVFAIPGSIYNSGSKGNNCLIKQGAKLITEATDVMEEFQGWIPAVGNQEVEHRLQQPACELDAVEQQLIDLLGFDPVSIDLLQQQIGWPLVQLTQVLMMLELKGLVENKAGCYQRIVKAG